MKEKKSIFGILMDNRHRSRTISYTMVAVAYIVLEILLKTGNLSSLFTGLLVPATCYLVAAIGLNLNVGVSGELNLGQAGFMAVGAFSGVCVSGLLKASVPHPASDPGNHCRHAAHSLCRFPDRYSGP